MQLVVWEDAQLITFICLDLFLKFNSCVWMAVAVPRMGEGNALGSGAMELMAAQLLWFYTYDFAGVEPRSILGRFSLPWKLCWIQRRSAGLPAPAKLRIALPMEGDQAPPPPKWSKLMCTFLLTVK